MWIFFFPLLLPPTSPLLVKSILLSTTLSCPPLDKVYLCLAGARKRWTASPWMEPGRPNCIFRPDLGSSSLGKGWTAIFIRGCWSKDVGQFAARLMTFLGRRNNTRELDYDTCFIQSFALCLVLVSTHLGIRYSSNPGIVQISIQIQPSPR